MKKFFRLIPVALIFSALSTGNALAKEDPSWDPVNFTIATYYYSNNVYMPANTFNVGQQAFLRVNVPDITDLTSVNISWNDNTSSLRLSNFYDQASLPGHMFWINGPTFATSDIGAWNINADYTHIFPDLSNDHQEKSLQFVVTPEPTAVMLYGLGGIPLAFSFFRRRKAGLTA